MTPDELLADAFDSITPDEQAEIVLHMLSESIQNEALEQRGRMLDEAAVSHGGAIENVLKNAPEE